MTGATVSDTSAARTPRMSEVFAYYSGSRILRQMLRSRAVALLDEFC